MRRHALLIVAIAGWMLVYSRHGTEWLPMGQYSSSSTCHRVMDARAHDEASREMGTALASQPADNPMRQRAYQRAWRRVQPRFRCVHQR